MTGDSDSIVFEKNGRVGWVYFSQPERMNALSTASMRAMWTGLAGLESDPEIRAVAFTGRGDAFCAGMEMAGLEKAAPLAARRRSLEVQMLTNRIADFSLPTIAAVNGVAMGVGLEICLACDLVLASTAARFAFPEARLGMIPCGGGTQRLARLIGLRRAREMVLTGRILDAEQAVQWGLANEVTEPGELVPTVEKTAEKLAMGGKIALYQAKRCLNRSLDLDLNRGLEYETECYTTCFTSGETASALHRFASPSAPAPAAEEPEPKAEDITQTEPAEDTESVETPDVERTEGDEEEAVQKEEEDSDDIFE